MLQDPQQQNLNLSLNPNVQRPPSPSPSLPLFFPLSPPPTLLSRLPRCPNQLDLLLIRALRPQLEATPREREEERLRLCPSLTLAKGSPHMDTSIGSAHIHISRPFDNLIIGCTRTDQMTDSTRRCAHHISTK